MAFTTATARALGLPIEQISVIAGGAFLHDFSKMAIPDKILRKPEPLPYEEMLIMREHLLPRIPNVEKNSLPQRGLRYCLLTSGKV
jgi:response regulator RpfG family c-di-GMP phosphodiesterase